MVPFYLIIDLRISFSSFFFFNDTATTEIYTLSLHDALPICDESRRGAHREAPHEPTVKPCAWHQAVTLVRSEEHTSELQSHLNLVCRLLLEKKKNRKNNSTSTDTRRV